MSSAAQCPPHEFDGSYGICTRCGVSHREAVGTGYVPPIPCSQTDRKSPERLTGTCSDAGLPEERPPIDHRELLRKYIAHVSDYGINFLGRIGHPGSNQHFTAEEKDEIVRLANEPETVTDLIPEVDPVIVAVAVRKVRDMVNDLLRGTARPAVSADTFAAWFRHHADEELEER